MKRFFPALISILLFPAVFLFAQNNTDYGLQFLSHEVNKDLRTGFAINPIEGIKNGFSFSFQLRLIEKNPKFGYIFRLVINDQESIDFISNSHARPGHKLTVVERDEPVPIFFDIPPKTGPVQENWLKVTATLNPATKTVTITLDGKTLSGSFHQADLSTVRLFFGSNAFGKFSTSDVAPVAIRDLRIINHRQKLLYHWPFGQHQGNKVYDLARDEVLAIHNPVWLIDAHTHWKKRASFATTRYPQLSFRADSATVLAATADSLYAYSLRDGSLVKKKYARGTIFPVANNQMIFHPSFRELWQYDLKKEAIARYNFETNSWSSNDGQSKEPAFWHHNKFIAPSDSSLLLFGGYGNFRYKNLVQRYDHRRQHWDSVAVHGTITPRYLSAAGRGLTSSEILLFGGYGNASGRQELSPGKLYDLYSFDLATHTFKKRWEKESQEEDYVVGNSLVVNTADSSFYTLCYPVHKYASLLYLRKHALSSPADVIVGDTIPYLFQDTRSYCDLFYSQGTQELLAVTSCPVSDSLSEVSIYSIAYPAISRLAALQLPATPNTAQSGTWLYWLAGGLLVTGILLALARQRKKQAAIPGKTQPPTGESQEETVEEALVPAVVAGPLRRSQPGIYLIGGLQVINKEGMDITASFTPALRQLLVLVTLHTAKTGKGISSVQLKNILWPDKSEESARNNRGVQINKIRTLLGELGEAMILNENHHWVLSLDSTIACDYFLIGKLMDAVHQSTEEENRTLIDMASRGPLLPDLEYEWLDGFKSAYASKMIDTMLILAEKPGTRQDPALRIAHSEVIFLQDPLNETALVIKCQELSKLGKHTVAKSVYRNFVHEYNLTMGIAYTRPFEELVQKG